MIRGVGTDIIEIERMRRVLKRQGKRFMEKLFTADEQAYCLRHADSAPQFAARFAAKEAVVKALGVGFGPDVQWLDIEIRHDQQGKPVVVFSKKIDEKFSHPSIYLSISHCRAYATAFAVWSLSKE